MKKKLKIIGQIIAIIFMWTVAAFAVETNVSGFSGVWRSVSDVVIVGSVCIISMTIIMDITNL